MSCFENKLVKEKQKIWYDKTATQKVEQLSENETVLVQDS